MSLIKFVDDLFDSHEWHPNFYGQLFDPHVDFYPLEGGGLELKADLPGTIKDDLTLSITGQILTLSGERKRSVEQNTKHWHYAERSFGKFSRRFRLPFVTDIKEVTAKFENGVLTVNIPKPEGFPAGQITIE